MTIYEAALESSRWNSMDPERIARTFEREFEQHLELVRQLFEDAATDPAAAAEEHATYASGYEPRYRAWLAARGRTASPMVTGPSNFPTRRNGKALDTERRRSDELSAWTKKAEKAALARLRPPPDPARELATLEELQETMKAANKIVRKKSWPDERKIASLVADLGLREDTARRVLEPDFCRRIGFPPHQLASVRGKIKRLRQTLAE